MKLQNKGRRLHITNIRIAEIKKYLNAGSISYTSIYNGFNKIPRLFSGDGML